LRKPESGTEMGNEQPISYGANLRDAVKGTKNLWESNANRQDGKQGENENSIRAELHGSMNLYRKTGGTGSYGNISNNARIRDCV
jgi:hypothetical protein